VTLLEQGGCGCGAQCDEYCCDGCGRVCAGTALLEQAGGEDEQCPDKSEGDTGPLARDEPLVEGGPCEDGDHDRLKTHDEGRDAHRQPDADGIEDPAEVAGVKEDADDRRLPIGIGSPRPG
jgi:hypothetical protein